QQTLEATFDWSWDLLATDEQDLLRRLSVFVGGWTLRAAESVCGEIIPERGPAVVDLLTVLVDKSLVIYDSGAEGDEARYHLLETIREHTAQKLAGSDIDAARNSHRNFYLAWAEEVNPKLWGPE